MSAEVTSSPKTQPDSRGRRLESWKEIAAYLGRDVTTARRWERREGLPVYRLQHNKLGSIYAYTSELDAWRDKQALAVASDAPDVEADHRRATIPRARRWLLVVAVLVGVAAIGLLAGAYVSSHSRSRNASITEQDTVVVTDFMPLIRIWEKTISRARMPRKLTSFEEKSASGKD